MSRPHWRHLSVGHRSCARPGKAMNGLPQRGHGAKMYQMFRAPPMQAARAKMVRNAPPSAFVCTPTRRAAAQPSRGIHAPYRRRLLIRFSASRSLWVIAGTSHCPLSSMRLAPALTCGQRVHLVDQRADRQAQRVVFRLARTPNGAAAPRSLISRFALDADRPASRRTKGNALSRLPKSPRRGRSARAPHPRWSKE
jgi:hypothetical protein